MNARRSQAKARRRIAVVTGSRAEYGLLRSTLAAIQRRRGLQLQLVVTGMHLLRRCGSTVREILADGFPVAARVRMQKGDDSPTDAALGVARGVAGMAREFSRLRSDVVLVLGDRIEALAAALAAVTTGRLLCHIHGGDVAIGDLDDSIRHSISKLAHFHFAASQDAARRLVRMGERPDHVFVVGAPGLDELRALLPSASRSASDVRPPSGAALVVQHPIGRSARAEYRATTALLASVRSAGLARWIVCPNTDRGSRGVLQAIERHAADCRGRDVRVWQSMPRATFLRAMLSADVLIGNSSCGILEAPYLGVPSVDVGSRQAGRLCGGPSVVHAAESPRAIRRALGGALRQRHRANTRGPYGDGRAGERIAALLSTLPFSESVRRKQICY